ncbi:hypothetical protein vBCtySFA70_00011 [Clostridium phage vB_CtyS-FA70]|nr:hypothetical protein vBCtySFA70_00011 [Clostridium phage vB_CtyS-FA70]
MRLIQIVGFLNTVFPDISFYPLQFPYNTTGGDEAIVDIVNGGMLEKAKTKDALTEINIQIMTRSEHPSDGEELANTMIETLHHMTGQNYEDEHILLIQAQSPNPYYNGQDEDNFFIYTTDFRLLIS